MVAVPCTPVRLRTTAPRLDALSRCVSDISVCSLGSSAQGRGTVSVLSRLRWHLLAIECSYARRGPHVFRCPLPKRSALPVHPVLSVGTSLEFAVAQHQACCMYALSGLLFALPGLRCRQPLLENRRRRGATRRWLSRHLKVVALWCDNLFLRAHI